MSNKLIVAPSPHIHSTISTTRLMADVIIALIPALAVSVWVYGLGVLTITATSIAACVLFEYLIQKFIVKGRITICNLSAVVTGLLLAFNLPANIPLWIPIVGALVAIGVAKMPFGGLGKNPFNPAITARVFLLIAYPAQMTSFAIPAGADAFSGATALSAAKQGLVNFGNIDFARMAIGEMGGSFGEIASLALLLGGAYLLYRGVIRWYIPTAVLGTIALFALCVGLARGFNFEMALCFTAFHILCGGAILGAVYMATDYVTSPMTPKGMIIFGVGIGVITMLIRLYGAYPEGMSFAILIMNGVVPLINKYVKPKRFGTK